MTRTAALLTIALLVGARPADAAPRRVHWLSTALGKRLSDGARHNISSLVSYLGPRSAGSGVVVGTRTGRSPGSIRALVLTSNHVIDANQEGARLFFADSSKATNSRVVARNRFLDYALLEVELPDTAKIAAANLLPRRPNVGDKIYSMGGQTSMSDYPIKTFLGGGPTVRREAKRVMAEYRTDMLPTIATGRVVTAPFTQRVEKGSRIVRNLSMESDAPGAPGSSGGPVFDAVTHQMLGINGNGRRNKKESRAGMSPLDYISYDLAKQYNRGRIPQSSQDAVYSLLEQLERTQAGR